MFLKSVLPFLVFTKNDKPPAFFLAGDSTTAVQSSNGGGWGNGFLSFLRSPAWGMNYGHNGATTVSFVEGGDWARVLSSVWNNAENYSCYVTIQFGHNDQKPAANISLSQYQANLERMAGEVESAGGTAVLVTPLTRRVFTSLHNATDSLHDQRLATLAAGTNAEVRVLDLNQASLEYVDAIGNISAQVYDLNGNDTTHLNAYGSTVFGRMVADLLLGHPPVVTTEDGKGTNPTQRRAGLDGAPADCCLRRWIKGNESVSYDIWHGLPA
ncbi:SGNH hydrolase-type esterase domain-containing protein [Diplogelasinospora grovesii]|uniref:SGNH hydrolase-type esterase domain-containing protein n=1 Tax=Diplogelasinospora grovesii TaxID=303347 RepID=A0AAN6NB30_9PEZI|nr:SGNH hydrolase-type esterase domain-containing protein [Diplogelasinospora grovesii]